MSEASFLCLAHVTEPLPHLVPDVLFRLMLHERVLSLLNRDGPMSEITSV
jgi:hypothetical protein